MISELAEEFGSAILDDDGSVITGKLAERAFASPEATRAMNAITFPRITERAMEYILNIHCTPRTDAEVLVIEVPLLTEVPEFAKLADEVIAVNASEDVRLMRAIERGMNPADALARIDAQPSDTERDALADTICDNAGSHEELAAWVDQWFEEHHFDGSHTTCSIPEVSSATEGE